MVKMKVKAMRKRSKSQLLDARTEHEIAQPATPQIADRDGNPQVGVQIGKEILTDARAFNIHTRHQKSVPWIARKVPRYIRSINP